MDIFQQFEYEFDELVDTVCLTHQGVNLYSDLWFVNSLHESLKSLYNERTNELALLREDVQQQLRLLWLNIEGLWKENKPPVALKTYLLRRSVWGLRDWVTRQIRFVTHSPDFTCPDDLIVQLLPLEEKQYKFKLDIRFLLFGSSYFPVSELSPYERYLMLLNFKEEKNILEIAKIVQKDRAIVGRQIRAVIDKLRRLTDGTHTEGPSRTINGTAA